MYLNTLIMDDLIKALQIFLKYKNNSYPTICEHEVLIIVGIEEWEISDQDKAELEMLGFRWSNQYENWISYKYGSA